tara:strand:+ start:1061 stop:1345 length:285 start_codon:yes stop_codon:yes gene_type:complete
LESENVSKSVKVKFGNLAEEVLKEANEALAVTVIIDRVAAKALTKIQKNGRVSSNRNLKQVTNRVASAYLRQDKRFVKTEQDAWRVNLWTLAEE